MLNRLIYFLKYNNATIIILAIILVLGGGVLAAGPEAVGGKQTKIEGVDNSLLLAADINNFNLDFKIIGLKQDEANYYVTYEYLDLAIVDGVWSYQLNQATRKISKKIKEDLGVYLSQYLAKQAQARRRELKNEQAGAAALGGQKRVEVTEYSGLVGRTLDLAAKVFPGYEPVKKKELASPEVNLPAPRLIPAAGAEASGADNLTQIYNDYLASHPEIFAPVDGDESAPADEIAADTEEAAGETPAEDAPPIIGEPASAEATAGEPVAAEAPAVTESESVEIIELPASAPADENPAPEPAAEPAGQ